VLATCVHPQHLGQQAAQLADGDAHLLRVVGHTLDLHLGVGCSLAAAWSQVHVAVVVHRELMGAPHVVAQIVAGEQERHVANLTPDQYILSRNACRTADRSRVLWLRMIVGKLLLKSSGVT
jgi:hypothetical protein